MATNDLEILLIEDDVPTALLTREALALNDLHHRLTCLRDGEEALSYLRREQDSLPSLIFLDLHLPRVPGLRVLEQLKADSNLKRIPVIVVSGASNPKEIRQAYELHASCFIRKPSDLDDFLRFVKVCFEFWGTVVTFAV